MMMMMMMSSLFLLLSLLIPLFSHVTACDPRQRESLLHFKAGVLLDDELTSWRPSSNCCSWEGVTCDPASGLLAELDLHSRGIYGGTDSNLHSTPLISIPPSTYLQPLFNLTSLNKLNLADNRFDGPIPDGIGSLGELMSLDLSNAGFFGQIPIGIAKLTNLATLDLSGNFYWIPSGTLHLKLEDPDFGMLIRNLSNLKELRLDGVNISAHGHQWGSAVAKSTPRLRELSLTLTWITGPLDSSLAELHDLSVIRLNGNWLNCPVPEFFGSYSSLKLLQLDSCQLTGTFPENVFHLKNLTRLDLSSNPMLSGSLPEFVDESKLETLILEETNFSGSLPYTIGELKSLITMNLLNCRFSGTIPSSITNLTQLVSLDLTGNKLEGEIPRFVFDSSNLQYLSLASNDFSGEVTLDQFGQNLDYLDLSNNRIAIKDTLYNNSSLSFSKLTVLRLAACNLSRMDTLYDNSSLSFPKLTILRLAACNLTRIPSFLRHHDQMDVLDLSRNMIHGAIPSWIWSIREDLNLSCNFFTSVEPFELDANTTDSSRYLDLHSNFLEGPIPLPWTDLAVVDYSSNYFSSSIPSNISSYLAIAYYFSVAKNNLMGEIPPSICEAPLLLLDLSSNNFTGSIPRCLLEGDNKLVILNLQGNQLSGRIPQSIKKGCCLHTLQLNDNHLQGQVPDTIVNCNELEVIDLGNNHIHDSFPLWLSQIPSLRVIILKSNEFYGPLEFQSSTYKAANIFNFSRLQILDISSNQFNGTLSPHFFMNLRAMMDPSTSTLSTLTGSYGMNFGSTYQVIVTITSKGTEQTLPKILTIFKSIDLSNNAFMGEIPEIFGEFQSLVMLNLSHNSLTGKISSTLGSMKQLESLDLSANHLSGEIPQELTSLTFLGFLNLSNNDLVGKIPKGNQFSTFSNSSFKGNEGLCGIPLSKQCGNNATQMLLAPSKPDNSPSSTYVIGLALFTGLGYGVGLAAVIVLQNVSWKHISAWLRAAATNAMN